MGGSPARETPAPHPCPRRSCRATLYTSAEGDPPIPTPRSHRRPVHLRLDDTTHTELERIAATEPGLTHDGRPNVSAAIRRLLHEALTARAHQGQGQPEPQASQASTIRIQPRGLAWIDAQAATHGRSRDDEVRALLHEAKHAREHPTP